MNWDRSDRPIDDWDPYAESYEQWRLDERSKEPASPFAPRREGASSDEVNEVGA